MQNQFTSQYFRECRAKSGKGAERNRLIADLRMAESCYEHMIIRCSASGNSAPQEWLDEKAAFAIERDSIIEQLKLIVGPWKPRS